MRQLLTALTLAPLLLLPLAHAVGGPPVDPADPLAALGLAVTTGAAPGYVPDRACAICHRDIAQSYREVGMARSFYRPSAAEIIEELDGPPFFHRPSNRYYEMRWQNDGLLFRRYRKNDRGEVSALFERRVDWILGSGHTSRSYLYQTEAGELFQLPISWYSQSGTWGMAPGYDNPTHQGVTRRVRRECMFCHNGYPDVPAEADRAWAPQWFPSELPEGTGCQRCHGPGADHARLALRGPAGPEEGAALAATIVNPGRLPPEERDSVCFQCHLQPSVAFTGVRRFARDDYAFRPGEPLADYILPIDPDEANRGRGERFEINHHPYRLMQSRCWQQSERQLSCLTCHDPHRKVPAAERAAHYRTACLGCHEPEACGRPPEAAGDPLHAPGEGGADCVACHMPPRRTEDVVQVTMTDHLIRRRPAGRDLTRALDERDPVIRAVELFPLAGGPRGAEAALYRAVAEVRANPTARTVDRLTALTRSERPEELAPWIDLARGQLGLGRLAQVEQTARLLLERAPDLALAHEWLGLALAGQGRLEQAEAALRRSLELDPTRPEARFNLALLLLPDRPAEAAAQLGRAVEQRPVLVEGWYRLADAYLRLGRTDEAIEALRRALSVDPDHAAAGTGLRSLERGVAAAERNPSPRTP